jgi:salicylate hydroxylase
MYKHIEECLASKKNLPYSDKYVKGLPIGLKLSNGITVGQE